MLPGVQITIIVLVAIILLSTIGTMIFLTVDLIKDGRERKIKLSEKEVRKLMEMAEKELSQQRDDNIHTNS